MKLAGAVNFDDLEQAVFTQPSGVFGIDFAGATLGDIIGSAIPIVMFFAGVILLIMAIISGVNMMTSAGDPQKAQAARARLTYAVIGFAFILFAYWIVQFFGVIFDIDQILDIFPL